MLQATRFRRITALLATFEQLSTERVAQELGVSRETVRRDVLELEAQGSLRRVHGGIVALDEEPREPPLSVRQAARARHKRAIARAAAARVEPGQTLFVDAGSTTALLAEALAALQGVTVITNGLDVARRLMRRGAQEGGNEVVLLGGHLDAEGSATYGDVTVADIHRYRADLALLSPVGISAQYGATSYVLHEAVVARAMAARAGRCWILADYSKIGQCSRSVYAAPADIDMVISDARAAALPAWQALCESGCKTVLA